LSKRLLGNIDPMSPSTSSGRVDSQGSELLGPWSFVWLVVLLLFAGLFLAGAAIPELFFASLFYHLGVPNLVRLEHRIYKLPLAYSTFIMTAHMLWGFALTLGNELAPKLLNVTLGAGLAAAFAAYGQRWLSRGSGLLAGVLFLSMPVTGYVLIRGA